MTVTKKLFLVPLMLMVNACVSLLPEPPAPSKKIILSPELTLDQKSQTVPWHLSVEKPYANDRLDTTRVNLVRKIPSRLIVSDDIADVEWEERLSDMVQKHIVHAFEKSNLVPVVGRSNERFNAKYRLETDIRSFSIHLDLQETPVARVEISAKIIDSNEHKSIKQKFFSAEVEIAARHLDGFITALEKAYAMVISQLVSWTVQ